MELVLVTVLIPVQEVHVVGIVVQAALLVVEVDAQALVQVIGAQIKPAAQIVLTVVAQVVLTIVVLTVLILVVEIVGLLVVVVAQTNV